MTLAWRSICSVLSDWLYFFTLLNDQKDALMYIVIESNQSRWNKIQIVHVNPLLKLMSGSAPCSQHWRQIDGLVQNCSNSIAKALELLQSCTKPLMYSVTHQHALPSSELTRPICFSHDQSHPHAFNVCDISLWKENKSHSAKLR